MEWSATRQELCMPGAVSHDSSGSRSVEVSADAGEPQRHRMGLQGSSFTRNIGCLSKYTRFFFGGVILL